MVEPEQYIFEEWDSMCALAHKARQGNCPLLEDEVLVEMHKYVGAQDKRIAELEKDIAFLQSCVNSGETATLQDRPSERAKQLNGGDFQSLADLKKLNAMSLEQLKEKLKAIDDRCEHWKSCADGSYEMALEMDGYWPVHDEISRRETNDSLT